jgi:hypothetical protein
MIERLGEARSYGTKEVTVAPEVLLSSLFPPKYGPPIAAFWPLGRPVNSTP